MKTIFKISVIIGTLVMMLIIDIPVLPVHLVPDADAIFGVRRRAWRRGMVIGYTAGAATATAAASANYAAASSQEQAATAKQQSATAQQQSATAQQQSATAKQQSAAAQHQAAAPAPSGGGPLPLGTVASYLPPGCVSTPYQDVEYYKCGDNYYRAMFQGNSLVYVTVKP
jgi:hypothetical protein